MFGPDIESNLPVIPTHIVNLTPHEIKLMSPDCKQVLIRIPPSGDIVRVKQTRKPIAKVEIGGIIAAMLVEAEYGDIEGLPEFQPGKLYAVSTMAAIAIKKKKLHPWVDFIVVPDTGPGSVCRDEKGQIVGVRYLIKP